MNDAAGRNIAVAAPVAVDLDSDGVEMDEGRIVSFEKDNDGYKERTVWVSPDDGLLVYDLARDGTFATGDKSIDQTREISFASWMSQDATDLEALAEAKDKSGKKLFDTNGEGKLNSQGTSWLKFYIWQDSNGDGVSSSSELHRPEEFSISEILRSYDRSSFDPEDFTFAVSAFQVNGFSSAKVKDLVVIPTQGASMDAKGAAKTIRLIRNQERMARRPILHSVLLTRTSAAVTSRALKNVREQLDKAGIEVFSTSIVERAAYRDIFDYGGLLSDLTVEQVSNIERARENAREFAGEVIAKLRSGGIAAKVA